MIVAYILNLKQVTEVVHICRQRVFLKLELNKIELQNLQLEVLIVELYVFRYRDATKPLLHGSHQPTFVTRYQEYFMLLAKASQLL